MRITVIGHSLPIHLQFNMGLADYDARDARDVTHLLATAALRCGKQSVCKSFRDVQMILALACTHRRRKNKFMMPHQTSQVRLGKQAR